MAVHGAKFFIDGAQPQSAARHCSCRHLSVKSMARWVVAAIAGVGLGSIQASRAGAQDPAKNPRSPFVTCADEGQDLVMPPELRSSGGKLTGTILLVDQTQRLPVHVSGEETKCRPLQVRVFRGKGLRKTPRANPRNPDLQDPMPGPTLWAHVGDLVQLTFLNTINPKNFERGLDLGKEACAEVGTDGAIYPVGGAGTPLFEDKFPNCLHASSTANIHFHGTHTNPNSTGDNVYLQIRPLPMKKGHPTTTPKEATIGFDEFFKTCTEELRNPLNSWPATWYDLPKSWTDKQRKLLVAYQRDHRDDDQPQPLWDKDKEERDAGRWPIYYIGAFPYCYALPSYPGKIGTSPAMGQAPGTHWYHAHKHGSTAINVAEGMTGAFIIEGKYDDDLNAAYGSYILKDERNRDSAWNTRNRRSQKILVLTQLSTTTNAMTPIRRPKSDPKGVDFSVNGRLRPKLHMQPGEVQLWRIVNTSGRTAAYFMPPEGLEWRQIAQDGVQYDYANYHNSQNKPFYMAPANRVDLLVKAPMNPPMNSKPIEVRIQNVMARSEVRPNHESPDPEPGILLFTVEVGGDKVMRDGQPAEMPFLALPEFPKQPEFLADISDEELKQSNYIKRKLVFNSKRARLKPAKPSMAGQHTINDIQFGDEHAQVTVTLGATEEWTVKNMTNREEDGPVNSRIDHPLHIHINPFQVTEMFDPNESLVDKTTGHLVVDEKGNPIPRYVFFDSTTKENPPPLVKGQCLLDVPKKEESPLDLAKKEETWKPCDDTKQGHWWDVFAIPAAKKVNGKVIPGYFKMRSRFVDYPGLYVLHCHILIHEDRGMMFRVEVQKAKPAPHH